MCGRVFVKSTPDQLLVRFAWARAGTDALDNLWPRFNGAPGQDYPIIVREPDMPGGMFIIARWGFIPRWNREANPQVKPINATAEKSRPRGLFRVPAMGVKSL